MRIDPDLPNARRLAVSIRWPLALLMAAAMLVAVPMEADARSSGGYSRSGGSGRTPSFGGGGGGYRSGPSYRTPSTRRGSGGYSRSSTAPSRQRYVPPVSAGDRSVSQDRSGSAFDTYRRRQDAPQYNPRQPSPQAPSWPQPNRRRPSTQPQAAPGGWYGNNGWAPPPFNVGNRNFGVWDGLLLWTLLSNLNRPGAGAWFHDNQNDPGYREWRREAEQRAEGDADLRRQLDELDRQLTEREAEPRNPGAPPADVPAEVAEAQPTRTPGAGSGEGSGRGGGLLLPILALGIGGVAFVVWRRTAGKGGTTGGSGMTRSPASTIGGILRQKMSGTPYEASKFRVGMTLALDPTPFVLAGSAIKLQPPAGSGSGQVSVEAVGRVVAGGTAFVRLHLPGGQSLVQIHLDAAGEPDECRLFGLIDEVTPADADEWGAWLDPAEGMIGWPDFQTKDGTVYDRVWSPGEGRVAPRKLVETIETLSGTRTVESEAMLYAAATGVAEPGPATEYLLVAAVHDGGRAVVEIRSGIDINPVTLQLA